PLPLSPFLAPYHRHHPDLPSFPTRRSSDLDTRNDSVPRQVPDREDGRQFPNSCHRQRRQLVRSLVTGSARFCLVPDHWRHSAQVDRKSTRLNSSHGSISYAVFCLKKKKNRH